MPVAAPDYGALAAQLGQALSALIAYEMDHTQWDQGRKGFMWVTGGEPIPVMRLRQQVAPPERKGESKQAKQFRAEFRRRVEARIESGYDEGYRAGLEAAKNGEPADWSKAVPWNRPYTP